MRHSALRLCACIDSPSLTTLASCVLCLPDASIPFAAAAIQLICLGAPTHRAV